MMNSDLINSVLDVKENVLLSKNGELSLMYFLQNPEPYSLTEENLDKRLNTFFIALNNSMPDRSFFFKQDICIQKFYDPQNHYHKDNYLSQAQRHHLEGRKYTEHTCVLIFTLTGLASLEAAYQKSAIRYDKNLEYEDKERFINFCQSVEGSIGVLKSLDDTLINPMLEGEIRYYIKRLANGFSEDDSLVDSNFSEETYIGKTKFEMFALSDGSYLPEVINSVIDDNSLKRNNIQLRRGFMDDLGVYFPYSHVYNQIFYFKGNDVLKDELENKKTLFSKHQKYSGYIEKTFNAIKEFQDYVIDEDLVLVKAHCNIMLFNTDKKELKKAERSLSDILKRKEITPYRPSFQGAENLFMGSIAGRSSTLDPSYFFLADLKASLSLLTNYSDFKDDEQGVVVFDRIHNKPFLRDTIGTSRTGGHAKNFVIVAPTEGGKSSFALDKVEQDLQNGTKVIYVEFGESCANLVKLYPKRSVQIKFTPNTPLGINPFDIDPKKISPSQLTSLNQIVLKYWKLSSDARLDNNLNSSIIKFLQDYYANYLGSDYSFPSFYTYVKENYIDIITRKNIPKDSFDLESFLNVCVHYLPGEMYENICLPNPDIEGAIKDKDLINFELSGIKDDSFMVSLLFTVLQDTVNEKITKDKSVTGGLYYDEYGEIVMLKDQYTGAEIHPSVAYGFQKFRKSNAFIGIILQTIDQLPKDENTQGIISNTQMLYVLPSTTVVYKAIIEAFKIENQKHIDLMYSIENNFKGSFPRFSEVFMRFKEKYAVAARIEFSRQKLYAFQTDGSDWQFLKDDYKITKNLPNSINNLIQFKNEKDDFTYVPSNK